jgi:outer membrane protein OmpA-like peptidoglycan-associated protein
LFASQKPALQQLAFSPEAVQRQPLLLLGTLTAMNPVRNSLDTTAPASRSVAAPHAQTVVRLCLALVNLKTGLLLAKTLAFADANTVDSTLAELDRDAPAWVPDAATQGYVRSCQGARVGDALHPDYAGRVGVAALLAQATDDYAAGRYAGAQAKYQAALALPGGEQLRTHMGLYLGHTRLGNLGAAAMALGQVVDVGLDQQRLGLRLMFRPGTPAWDNRSVEQRSSPATAVAAVSAGSTGSKNSAADTLKQRVEQHRSQKAAALVALAQSSAPHVKNESKNDATPAATAKPAATNTNLTTGLLGPDEAPPWLAVVAQRAAQRLSCLELAGHTGTGAPEPINERLSLLRAEAVMRELARLAPALEQRMLASGQGSRQAVVGSGRNDSSDALDRRVELMVLGC